MSELNNLNNVNPKAPDSFFGGSTYTTFGFQQLAQFFQVVFGADEATDEGDGLAAPAFFLHTDA